MSTEQDFNDLLLKYPGLNIRRQNAESIIISGVAKVNKKYIRLKLHCPFYPLAKNFKLYVLRDGEYIECSILIPLPEHSQVIDIFSQLDTLAGHIQTPSSKIISSINENNIYAEIACLHKPENYDMQIDAVCSRIRFSNFAEYPQHHLELDLQSLHPISHSLPDCLPWEELFQKCVCTLSGIVSLFQKYIKDLEPFYESFLEIDELCYILQPQLPATKHNWRLFLLRRQVYLKLTIKNPFNALSSMSLEILGPTDEVEQLRDIYREGLSSSWDVEMSIHRNLLRIFDLCFFPMPSNELNYEELQYCNICYSYRLEKGDVPIVSCDNIKCSVVFHAACLREWFKTLRGERTFLDIALGVCPFCKDKLSQPFVELIDNE